MRKRKFYRCYNLQVHDIIRSASVWDSCWINTQVNKYEKYSCWNTHFFVSIDCSTDTIIKDKIPTMHVVVFIKDQLQSLKPRCIETSHNCYGVFSSWWTESVEKILWLSGRLKLEKCFVGTAIIMYRRLFSFLCEIREQGKDPRQVKKYCLLSSQVNGCHSRSIALLKKKANHSHAIKRCF